MSDTPNLDPIDPHTQLLLVFRGVRVLPAGTTIDEASVLLQEFADSVHDDDTELQVDLMGAVPTTNENAPTTRGFDIGGDTE